MAPVIRDSSGSRGRIGLVRRIISTMMRWVQIVLCVVLGLALLRFGVVWTLQGLNIWGGSFMSGSSRWLVIGVVLDIAGLMLLVQAVQQVRRMRASPSSTP